MLEIWLIYTTSLGTKCMQASVNPQTKLLVNEMYTSIVLCPRTFYNWNCYCSELTYIVWQERYISLCKSYLHCTVWKVIVGFIFVLYSFVTFNFPNNFYKGKKTIIITAETVVSQWFKTKNLIFVLAILRYQSKYLHQNLRHFFKTLFWILDYKKMTNTKHDSFF